MNNIRLREAVGLVALDIGVKKMAESKVTLRGRGNYTLPPKLGKCVQKLAFFRGWGGGGGATGGMEFGKDKK